MKYAEIDLPIEYQAWANANYYNGTRDGFEAHLRQMVTNPKMVAERLRWCDNCARPHDINMVDGAEVAYCQQCWATALVCNHCGTRGFNTVPVINGVVCRTCLEAYYVYCRNCNLAYPHGESRQHLHGADGCCESPAKEFTIPLQGGVIIRNDEVVAVEFEGGTIARSTIHQVVQYLTQRAQMIGGIYESGSRAKKMYDLAIALERTRDLVGLEEKNKDGTFVTRLKRHAYKEYALKLEPEVLTSIGNLVSTKTTGRRYNIAFTRNLNLPPAEFGHQGSCWWTEYKESRCALKSNGGMGMRDFDGERVRGRAWVMPMKVGVDGNLAPTFDAHSGIYFAFNGYGTLADEYHRVLAEMLGTELTVSVNFEAERYYVNSGAGKLLGPAKVVKPWAKQLIEIPLTAHSDLFDVESVGSAKTTKKEKAHV